MLTHRSGCVLSEKIISRERHAAERRDCILRSARAVFGRQGYADTNVESIAEHAGIAKGTLYLYFKSKEEIYLAALLEDALGMAARTREFMGAACSWEDKLEAYLQVRLEYLETHRDFLQIYLTEFRGLLLRGVPLHAEVQAAIRCNEEQLAQMFARAIDAGEVVPVDPGLAASAVSDLVRGLMERELAGSPEASRAAHAKFTLELLCRGLKRPDTLGRDSSR
jgi:AcrR family transcriptional regulator